MKIIRAVHLGMCFGVRDAIALALKTASSQPLTILGELVHNKSVLKKLNDHGISIVNTANESSTSTVMVTAHGASEKAIREVRTQGLNLIEATCPLVQYAHRTLKEMVAAGYYPVVVGQPEHIEVKGLTGDLAEFSVILSEQDVDKVPERTKYGVISQTTQPIARVKQLALFLQQQRPNAEVQIRDTVCQPTKQRQNAAVEMAKLSDLVVVVGGRNSNNTRELVSTCRRYCQRVVHVETAEELQESWFQEVQKVGLTAGTSTPDEIIAEVEKRISELALEISNHQEILCEKKAS